MTIPEQISKGKAKKTKVGRKRAAGLNCKVRTDIRADRIVF
jgi:hypothetical protein